MIEWFLKEISQVAHSEYKISKALFLVDLHQGFGF
jgi:hypothetical protein